jgi:uncharacterized membrane protein YfcA
MVEIDKIIAVGVVVFLSHLLEGITGFGCTVIALPFITMLLGIKMAVPLLCFLGMVLTIYVIIRDYKKIDYKEFSFIVLHAIIGLPIGIILFSKLSPIYLSLILAVFMIGVGVNGTIKTLKAKSATNENKSPKKNLLMRALLFAGGVVQGAFGTGGPFVVIYASTALQNKALFRVTLSSLWLSLNLIRIAQWTIQGTVYTPKLVKLFLLALPFVLAGTVAGDYLHHKVNEYYFRLSVYCVLVIAGVVMLVNNLLKI